MNKDMEKYFEQIKEIREANSKHKDSSKLGFLNVKIIPIKNTLQGFHWRYTYHDKKENKNKHISSIDLNKLKKKVEKQGLKWEITDTEKAKTIMEINNKVQKLRGDMFIEAHMKAGEKRAFSSYNKQNKYGVKYIFIAKHKDKKYWVYNQKHSVQGVRGDISIYSRSLEALKEKVIRRDLKWVITDEELYKKSLRINLDDEGE